jgi:hypothetical protein
LHQQQRYSQQPQPIKPEQQQQQGPDSRTATASAKSASTANGNGGTNSSSSSSSANGGSSSSSANGSGSGTGPPAPADKAGPGAPGYKRKVVYTGATTAAQHNMRTAAAAAALQQLQQQQREALEQPELPPAHLSKQQREALEQPELPPAHLSKQQGPEKLSTPQKPQHQQQQWRREAPAYQDPASGSSSSSSKLQQDTEQLKEQHWEQGHKHYTEAQQMQWQVQANYQKQPPQQQQYKVVQYSRGTSLLLALSVQPSGDYSLQKTKEPASAADLAAFGRTKPAKDGAAAAAKAAKELPLLVRPFHPYFLRVKKMLQATFLPSGYPTSVGSNYLEYTLWQV